MRRHVLKYIFFILITLLLISTTAQANEYPKISFGYSSIFDNSCANVSKQTIEPEAIKELNERLPVLHDSWGKDAPVLFAATVKLTGAKFEFRESKAAFHLCDAFSSMSLPLLFNARYFMRSIKGNQAGTMAQFSGLIFHETLHRYVDDCLRRLPNQTTPLLEKYRDEAAPVRNHLHLFALMNLVYQNLGREKDLEEIMRYEQNVSRYKTILNRAREIVDKEGSANLVRELKIDGRKIK